MSRTAHLVPGLQRNTRRHLFVSGIVQGIGFRPFVYQLAQECGLSGWIENTPQGANIQVEGPMAILEHFQDKLLTQPPRSASIKNISTVTIPLEYDTKFVIRESRQQGSKHSVISPDLSTCPDCLAEIRDPAARRYRYPFTTCAHCGPRFSIVNAIPFDRENTTMKQFPPCEDCLDEYQSASDRRFHAETIACPCCGPQVTLWDQTGRALAEKESALWEACATIREGRILAVKGLGGFQLWVTAYSDQPIQRLRTKKHRPRKPFALLFPTLSVLKGHCHVSQEEEALLTSPQAPIVLLRRANHSSLACSVAPDNPYVGAMLPYTPLHHLLMENLQMPVVATSGNRSEEPIVTDESEALLRLTGIADQFLVHNRPIARPVDDSVARVVNGNMIMLRRARGYAPDPLSIKMPGGRDTPHRSIIAVGGHLKNTIAVSTQNQVILSQHIGDLSTPEAADQFERTIADYLKLYNVKPQAIACDLHPDYRSTLYAKTLANKMNIPVIPVQHHFAHVLSCMAENGLKEPVLGIAWDGAGYGTDGMIWGGEFLLADYSGFVRVGHLKPFKLPGGETCMREPRRVALSLLYETFGEACLEMNLPPLNSLGKNLAQSLIELLKKDVNCSVTTSMGRMFDGISSILGLCHINTFEGEAAMALEFAAEKSNRVTPGKDYCIPVLPNSHKERRKKPVITEGESHFVADWEPFVKRAVRDILEGISANDIGNHFHQALTKLIVNAANKTQSSNLVLSGGVFQNLQLQNTVASRLSGKTFTLYTPRSFPPNDGGIALGQIVARLFGN